MNKKEFLKPISIKDVEITGNFWKDMMEKARLEVIPYQWEALNDRIEGAEPSYCMQNFKVASGKIEGTHNGCVFQDSDVAKWIEAVAYSLMWHPDAELEATCDGAVDDIVAAQQPDGYLNTYYIITDINKRFTNLKDNHELYCLGHFIEAAVAYYYSTGKDKLLNAMIKYVDLVDKLIGPEEGKIHGYPGHEIIELALVKLYKITKNEMHLKLASYFVEERGQSPNFFELENKINGNGFYWKDSLFLYGYYQADKPVREQLPIGHAVRGVYLYSGMADVARETEDDSLLDACKRIWNDLTHRQMYITGGIGPSVYGEAYTYDYDLPNDTVYAETCASIGLAFFAQRMLNTIAKSEYADVLERALYNGIISGMSADGKSFFYVNPLETLPEASAKDYQRRHVKIERQKWFGCSCCPPNLARILTSLSNYAYSVGEKELLVNMYMESKVNTELAGGKLSLDVKTNYPWDGTVTIKVIDAPENEVSIGLRIPDWCKKYSISESDAQLKNGYLTISKQLVKGDEIVLDMEMPVEIIEANPRVREDAGKLAVQRGPVVYCIEQADNGTDIHRNYITAETEFKPEFDDGFFGGAMVLKSKGKKLMQDEWDADTLYRSASAPKFEDADLKWIPYYLWSNRGEGEMTVWVHRA